MIDVVIAIAGNAPCGWAYQPRRDQDRLGQPVVGSVKDTPNRTLLYAANRLLESLGQAKPSHCGSVGSDGVHVRIRASQQYLVNGMNGTDNGNANRDLWAILHEAARQRSLEGFVIRWEHLPAAENQLRGVASTAASECVPVALTQTSLANTGGPAPWEDA